MKQSFFFLSNRNTRCQISTSFFFLIYLFLPCFFFFFFFFVLHTRVSAFYQRVRKGKMPQRTKNKEDGDEKPQ